MGANISSVDLKKNLESQISGIGVLNIKKAFTCTGAEFEISWIKNGGNKPQFQIDASKLVGNEASGEVHTEQDGGIIYGPLSGEFLQLAKTTSQVCFFRTIWHHDPRTTLLRRHFKVVMS